LKKNLKSKLKKYINCQFQGFYHGGNEGVGSPWPVAFHCDEELTSAGEPGLE
jgi:hypothetical protein